MSDIDELDEPVADHHGAIRRNLRTKPQILALLRSLPASSTLHLKRSLLDTVIREVENQA